MPPEPKGTSDNLSSAIGMPLFDDQGQSIGTLVQTPSMAMRQFGPLAIQTANGSLMKFQQGFYITGTSLQPRQLFIDSQGMTTGAINVDFPSGGTGTGRAEPAFSGTPAGLQLQNDLAVAEAKRQEAVAAGNLLEARQWEEKIAGIQNAFTTREREAGEEWSAEQNVLAEEANLKRQRLSTLTDLIQSFMASQSQARETLANLQPDPFRHAAVAGGIAPFGVTPQQGFQKQLRQFAGAAVPAFDASGSAASLEPVIAQLTGVQAPTAPAMFGTPTVGMARGGTVPIPFDVMNTIEMSKGADGSYSAVPLPFDVSARLVGENPDGTVNKTTEVMITGPQGVTILPLGKGAQEGGFFPFEPIKFDKETLLPALGTSGIFGSLGLDTIPKRTMFGPTGETITGGFGDLSRLGIAPRFVRDIFTGEIWRIEGNTRQRVTDPALMAGLAPADVVGAQTSEIQRLAPNVGGELSTALQVNPPVSTAQPSAFTKFATPIIEPTTGTLLPAPFMVAEQMNRLKVTNPTAFNLLLSAYKTAGVPVEAVFSGIQSSLVFGQARSAVGLR